MRFTKLLFLALVTWAFSLGSLQADEVILKNGKKLLGTIKSENGMGVMLEGGKDLILAGDIVDIRYSMKVAEPASEFYYAATAKEGTFEKAKDRRDQMLETVGLYVKTLQKMPKEGQELTRRNVEFRVAFLRGRLAAEFDITPGTALIDLKTFKEKHPNSWQISHCLQKLAEMQIAQGKFPEAEKTYSELSQAAVAEDVKQEAEFLAGKLSMQTRQYPQALARFQTLVAKLPKDSPVAIRATVAQTECLAMSGKAEEANKLLRQLVKESSDKELKALAHNALGKNLFEQKQYKEARWEFLWVDVVYNQNKPEHAKSLYYLWKTFRELNENERAQECFESLLGEQFVGSEYQRKALAETKK